MGVTYLYVLSGTYHKILWVITVSILIGPPVTSHTNRPIFVKLKTHIFNTIKHNIFK